LNQIAWIEDKSMNWDEFTDHWDEMDRIFESRTERNLARDLEFDVNDISGELARHSSLFAYWSALMVAAQDNYDELKSEFDLRSAEIRNEKRSFALNSTLKVTAQHLDDQVTVDSRTRGCQSSLRDAQTRVAFLKTAVRSLEAKLQSMIAVAANERAQTRGIDPVFRHYEEAGSVSQHDMANSESQTKSSLYNNNNGTSPKLRRKWPPRKVTR